MVANMLKHDNLRHIMLFMLSSWFILEKFVMMFHFDAVLYLVIHFKTARNNSIRNITSRRFTAFGICKMSIECLMVTTWSAGYRINIL